MVFLWMPSAAATWRYLQCWPDQTTVLAVTLYYTVSVWRQLLVGAVFQLRQDTLALAFKRAQVFILLVDLLAQFSEVTSPQAFVYKRRNSVNIMYYSVSMGSICSVFWGFVFFWIEYDRLIKHKIIIKGIPYGTLDVLSLTSDSSGGNYQL